MKNNSATQETRRRLLQAAGEVFADRGFQAATIKEITDKAGASLASVNYHFSDKAELYAAVLRRMADDAAHVVPPDTHLTGSAANRLRQFVRFFCIAMMGRERRVWEQMLMAREQAEPTSALEPLCEQVLDPLMKTLSSLVAELMDAPVTSVAVALAAASVIGQCIYYVKQKSMLGRVHPQLGEKPDMEKVADHIADFSLAGIRAQRVARIHMKRKIKL